MELKDILKVYRPHFRTVFVAALLGGFLGALIFYFYPVKYIAEGSVFVVREADSIRREEFRYEGYYAQQAASGYTETVIGMLESVDIRRKVLEGLEIPVTEISLRKTRQAISAKKAAPQIISLEIKQNSPEAARDLWRSLAEQVQLASQGLNVQGDPEVSVLILEGSPVVHEGYSNLWLNVVAGVLFGKFVAIIYIAFREYLK